MVVKTLLQQVQDNLSQSNLELIRKAYKLANQAHAGQVRASGEPYIQHPLAVAQILAELGLNGPTLAAGLLHDVAEDSTANIENLRQEFGEEVAKLVDGVTKLSQMDKWRESTRNLEEAARAESLRKMFLAMVEDVRVVLIKLADRLHNMCTLSALQKEKRQRIAKETLEIFSPLANRLGMWRLKRELDDLCFIHLYPRRYEEIAELFGFDEVDDFLAAVGYGDINSQQIAVKVMEAERGEEKLLEFAPPTLSTEGISVQGVGNLLTRFAGCCSPLAGQEIVGYITRGRGVTIHRKDCPNILYLKEKDQGRLIEVNWGRAQRTYPVMIEVRSYDRMRLMRDISNTVTNEGINISAANVTTNPKDHTATITATLEITGFDQLSQVLAKIRLLSNVFEARRRKR